MVQGKDAARNTLRKRHFTHTSGWSLLPEITGLKRRLQWLKKEDGYKAEYKKLSNFTLCYMFRFRWINCALFWISCCWVPAGAQEKLCLQGEPPCCTMGWEPWAQDCPVGQRGCRGAARGTSVACQGCAIWPMAWLGQLLNVFLVILTKGVGQQSVMRNYFSLFCCRRDTKALTGL